MSNRLKHHLSPDWQIVQVWPGFVVEVNCNGGGHRRRYPDGRTELID